jgi:hypothetical protein
MGSFTTLCSCAALACLGATACASHAVPGNPPPHDAGRFDGIVVEGWRQGDAAPEAPGPAPDAPDAAWWTYQSMAPSYPTTTDQGGQGDVTTYGGVEVSLTSSGGACGYGATGIRYYAAINENERLNDRQGNWDDGRICGQCARVWASTKDGIKESFVRITDRCADEYCGIDLGGAPAAEIMGDGPGRYAGGWEFVSCAGHPQVFDGPPALFIKEGSSSGWAAVQVRDPEVPVAGFQWVDPVTGAGGEFPPATGIFNFHLVPLAALGSPNPVRVTARFTDGSTRAITLTAAELGTPGATYPFP